MKKTTLHILFSLILWIIISFLHYVVYLDNTNISIWYLEWYTNAPLDVQNIVLQKEIRPNYFQPFEKIQYFYTDSLNPENTMIEENQNLFYWNTTIVEWYDIVQKYHTESWGMFMRPLVANEFPTILYFILQYILIILVFVNMYKWLRNYKKAV